MKVHFEWVLLCELKTPIFTLSHWGLWRKSESQLVYGAGNK
jgi:hypothetical protein